MESSASFYQLPKTFIYKGTLAKLQHHAMTFLWKHWKAKPMIDWLKDIPNDERAYCIVEVNCAYAIKSSIRSDRFVESAFVDVYGRGGAGSDLFMMNKMFEEFKGQENVVWNNYHKNLFLWGMFDLAKDLFKHMEVTGIRVDKYTLGTMLCGYTHKEVSQKQVTEAFNLYITSLKRYNIDYDVKHRSSLVTLLSKNGYVMEAIGYALKQPVIVPPMWTPILGYCENGKIGGKKIGRELRIKIAKFVWKQLKE